MCDCNTGYTQTSRDAACDNLVTQCEVPANATALGSHVMDACEHGGVCRVWELVDESEAEWQNDTGAGEWVVAVNVTVNITCLCSDDYMGDQCEICTHLFATLAIVF